MNEPVIEREMPIAFPSRPGAPGSRQLQKTIAKAARAFEKEGRWIEASQKWAEAAALAMGRRNGYMTRSQEALKFSCTDEIRAKRLGLAKSIEDAMARDPLHALRSVAKVEDVLLKRHAIRYDRLASALYGAALDAAKWYDIMLERKGDFKAIRKAASGLLVGKVLAWLRRDPPAVTWHVAGTTVDSDEVRRMESGCSVA